MTLPSADAIAVLRAAGWSPVGDGSRWRDPVDASDVRAWPSALSAARGDLDRYPDGSHTAGPFRSAHATGQRVEWTMAGGLVVRSER